MNRRASRRCPKDCETVLRAAPTGVAAPMGQLQHTSSAPCSPRAGRFRARKCHRQHCGCVFVPRQWNQRYCQQPECLRELRRWQATKRQRERRSQPSVRQQHAEAERQRRTRQREQGPARPTGEPPGKSALPAPFDASEGRAWSRSAKIPEKFCDRPGCFREVRASHRAPARYCSDECRQAVRRVSDRERKFQDRRKKSADGRSDGPLRSGGRDRRQVGCAAADDRALEAASEQRKRVRSYRGPTETGLSSGATHQEAPKHDRETSTGRRPRPPPSA
jgi:hypothetical protein